MMSVSGSKFVSW